MMMSAPLPPAEAMESVDHSLPSADEMKMHASGMTLNESSIMRAGVNEIDDVYLEEQPEPDPEPEPEHSLPHLEDVRLDSGIQIRTGTGVRRVICVICASVVLLALLIGVVVNITKSKSKSRDPRMNKAVTYLSQFSARSDLMQEDSPQYNAAKWIADQDQLRYPIPGSNDEDSYMFLQRYALAVLHFSTGGSAWAFPLNFLTGSVECDWSTNFNSDSGPFKAGVTCYDGNKVSMIAMPANNLNGELPPEMGLLTSLSHISMFANSLVGSLPSQMEMLTGLEFFAMHRNDLTGELPAWLFTDQLRILGLGNNDFRGPLPTTLSRASKLREMSLDDNKLSGDISVLNSLVDLQYLYLEDNKFTGEFSNTFLDGMMNLVVLDLSDNIFGGELPPHLLSHPTLVVLDVHDNNLGGNFPADLQENTALQFLAVHDNFISGNIPSNIRKLTKLRHLDLTDNEFDGQIPDSLEDLTDLTYLYLGENKFIQGGIPDFLQNMTALQELNLQDTDRIGMIPDWIGTSLKNLLLLDVGNNGLTGNIPDSIGNMPSAAFLLLNHNKLTGTLPDVKNLTNIAMIVLVDNNITGDASSAGICQGTELVLGQLQVMTADCAGNDADFVCECCTACCDGTESNECNKDTLLVANLDPYWENGYRRSAYVFSDDITFSLRNNN